jgi:hypothetical protein
VVAPSSDLSHGFTEFVESDSEDQNDAYDDLLDVGGNIE